MKLGYYDPTKRQESILTSWIQDPVIISDNSKEQATDSAHMATCLAMLVAAHKIISIAEDFSDEGNESEILTVKKSIESIIECYSAIV